MRMGLIAGILGLAVALPLAPATGALFTDVASPLATLGTAVTSLATGGANGSATANGQSGMLVRWDPVANADGYQITRCSTALPQNKAAGKAVSTRDANLYKGTGTLPTVTDGDITAQVGSYLDVEGTDASKPSAAIVDLGAAMSIDSVSVWHYYGDPRTYSQSKTEVSADGTTWTVLRDSAASGTYVESGSGLGLTFPRQQVRYIRDWIGSNTVNQYRHWTEIQAYDSTESTCLSGTPVGAVPGSVTTFSDVGLTSGTQYLYLVTATTGQRSRQVGSWSTWTTLPKPTGLRVTASSVESVDLAWDPVPRATGYRVWRDADLFTASTNSTTFQVRDSSRPMMWNRTYTFTVEAITPGSGSGQTTPVSRSIPVFLPGSTGGSWSATTSGITATWPAVSGATGYELVTCPAPVAVNKALGKPVTMVGSADTNPSVSPVFVTDGDPRANGNTRFASISGAGSATIDLGSAVPLTSVRVWHWYRDGRTYSGTKTQVSADGSTWTTVFDSAVSGTYPETGDGRTSTFARQNVRYIRDLATGNTSNSFSHWSEIMAFDSNDQACTLLPREDLRTPVATTTGTAPTAAGTTSVVSSTAKTPAGRVQAGYWLAATKALVPTGLRQSGAPSRAVTLSWNSMGPGVEYRLYRDGVQFLGGYTGTSITDDDAGLTASTAYTYTVEAYTLGGPSGQSAPVTMRTGA
jgi:hypothetical protein